MRPRRLVGSAALMVANIGAGGLNYAFQILGARRLSLGAYGELSAWLADLALLLSGGVVAQMVANFLPASGRQLTRTAAAALIGALAGGGGLVALAAAGRLAPWHCTVAAVGLSVGMAWLCGQLQAHLVYAGIAAAIAATAVVKLSAAIFGSFYLAVPLGLAAGCATAGIAALAVRIQGGAAHPRSAGQLSLQLGVALLLAIGTNLIPQVDILALRLAQPAEVIGQYAQVSLFAKIIFFGSATVLQVTLPLHLRARPGGTDAATLKKILKVEVAVFGAGSVAAVGFALVGPSLLKWATGIDLAGKEVWILFSCLIATALYGQLRELQLQCTALRWRGAVVRVTTIAAAPALAACIRPTSVLVYLVGAFAYFGLLTLVDLIKWARIRSREIS